MKYWMRGAECGTMADDGCVPGAIECSRYEYEQYVQSIPIVPVDLTTLDRMLIWFKKHESDLNAENP